MLDGDWSSDVCSSDLIVSLAHDLGMDVVAEGAESRADVLELRALGCEYAQGYVFGEPMSGEDARRMLARSYRNAAQ
jgi:EAL domain-containing protein (putative c-di-GMP-specific phosphodiesterase class I)